MSSENIRSASTICPADHAWRKGGVEKSAAVIAQRWWRTLSDEVTQSTTAQAALWTGSVCSLDGRKRRPRRHEHHGRRAGRRRTASGDAGTVPRGDGSRRTVSNQAQIGFRGNRYSLLPGHSGGVAMVRHDSAPPPLDVTDRHGAVLARHHCAPDGAGAVVRRDEHVAH